MERRSDAAARKVLDRLQTKEVLRAVLHSILFHRLFGTIRSRTFEVLDVTMVSPPSVDFYVCIVGICVVFGARPRIYAPMEAFLRDGDRRAPWFTGDVDVDAGEGRWRCQPAKDVLRYLGLTYRDDGGAGAGFGFYARGGYTY